MHRLNKLTDYLSVLLLVSTCFVAYLGSCLWAITAFAGDGVRVTSMNTARSFATPSGPYLIGGDTIRYGVGDNVRLLSVNVGGLSLARSNVSKPQIAIRRINNAVVAGERLTFFYPGVAAGNNINLEGDEALSMEQAMNNDFITSGGLDVFLNRDRGVERANNIERVDFVVPAGIVLPTSAALLAEVGTVANEKHGNNTYKIALITAIDGFGQPAGYGPLRTVEGNVDYGNMGRPTDSSGTALRNLYLRNGPAPVGANNGPVGYVRGDTNFIGLSFVSFAALGATPSQVVYGYSLFPNDVFDSNDLVGLADVPTDTSGGINGGDIYGGTFAIFSSAAAENETTERLADLKIEKTVETYDPTNQNNKSIPGNEKTYHLTVINEGSGSPDTDSLFIVDSLPPEVTFWGGDVDGGPEINSVSWMDNNSAMTFDFTSDVGFAQGNIAPSDFSACSYSPLPEHDPNVRFICIRPRGTMAFDPGDPSFTLTFRVRID